LKVRGYQSTQNNPFNLNFPI